VNRVVRFNSVPVLVRRPLVKSESSPTVDTGTGTATQEFYPGNKNYRTEPVPVSTPFNHGPFWQSFC